MSTLDRLINSNTQTSFLAALVASQLLSREQAQYVHNTVQQDKRGRAINAYAQLLVHQGLPGPTIRQCMERLGAEGDVEHLGQALISMGALTPQLDHQSRYQVRVILDRDRNKQVQEFLASRGGAPAPAAYPKDTSISGIVQLPPKPAPVPKNTNPAMSVPGPAVVKESAWEMPALAEADLEPPQFEVPDFVDTSDDMANRKIDKYRIIGRIGAGAMGTVYMADSQDEPTRPVALKVCKKATDEARGRFKREVLANSFFSHEGVIDVYDVGQTSEGLDYLAMEFFDGEDLEQILENETKLEPRRAVQLVKQVADTLNAAHECGVVHRDLKPANILISRDGSAAKLMDFGIAIIKDLGEFEGMVFKTVEGRVTGTPQYMSPEQAGCDPITPSSDLYSLGLVLYETLSGKFPFTSENANGFMACHMLEDPLPLLEVEPQLKSLPKGLVALVERLLSKSPDDRPPTAAAVSEELEAILPTIKERKSGRFFGFLWRGRGG